jgi:hypothetical protein
MLRSILEASFFKKNYINVQGGSNMTGTNVTCLHTISPGHIWTTLYIRKQFSSYSTQILSTSVFGSSLKVGPRILDTLCIYTRS